MLYSIIVNEQHKYWSTRTDDEMVILIGTGRFPVGCDVVGQFKTEEDKEQAEKMLWKLRPDLKYRP